MKTTYKNIADLNIGAIDAVSYSERKEKEFLAKIFLRDSVLDKVLEGRRYFLIGEKGTGKTAYATLLSNSEHRSTVSAIKGITGTDYERFIRQKQQGYLSLSSYTDIWRVILLLLLSDELQGSEGKALLASTKFAKLKEAKELYRSAAFSPEISNAIEFIENSGKSAYLLNDQVGKAGAHQETKLRRSEQGFQSKLHDVEVQFRDAISSLKLKKSHILFIDGIDIRPNDIDFESYLNCIKGLAHAALSLNHDFFANINDSEGRIKVVLLLRPDIFEAIGYHNSNAKIRDNAVQLDWKTTYADYPTSRLFRLVDGILAKQQGSSTEQPLGAAWKHYFSYSVPNKRIAERIDDPFISFLRYSFYRPRDIISFLLILQEYVKEHRPDANHFLETDFERCQQEYSDYLWGEVKNYLSFYHSEADFDELTGFFRFMKGKSRFSWRDFVDAYKQFGLSNRHVNFTIDELNGTPESFLQFLYSMNVIGYDETTLDKQANFVHWCFRDRTSVTLNPKIPSNLGAAGERPYLVHPGLARSLKVGFTSQ